MNANPFHGPQEALPFFIWEGVRSSQAREVAQAYTAGLVLVIMVLILFTAARILGSGAFSRRRKYPGMTGQDVESVFDEQGLVNRAPSWERAPDESP